MTFTNITITSQEVNGVIMRLFIFLTRDVFKASVSVIIAAHGSYNLSTATEQSDASDHLMQTIYVMAVIVAGSLAAQSCQNFAL